MSDGKTLLLLGADGQIGFELRRTLAPLGRVVARGRVGADLSDPDGLRAVVRELQPAVIVNAAAHTAVDRAESEPELAERVNGTAPGVLAEEAARLGAALVHYSTDYVFDGGSRTPYREDDPTGPLNAYGQSKLAGEQAVRAVGGAHLILRTSWVYGAHGRNFYLTVRRLAAERDELRIVDDQTGAPTWSRMIAEATAQILAACGTEPAALAERAGLYHLSAGGETTWCGFARAVVAALPGRQPAVTPIATADYPLPARRPVYSRLDCARLAATFGLRLPDWQDSLADCMAESSPG